MEGEGVDLTRRRGDAEEDAEKDTNKQKGRSRIPALAGWCAEDEEDAEEDVRAGARMDKVCWACPAAWK
jgi:hypothetical protein